MEQDTLQGKNRSLISRIGKLEIERDKLRKECERLDKQCQELNATLTFPSATESKADAHSTNWDDVSIIVNAMCVAVNYYITWGIKNFYH